MWWCCLPLPVLLLQDRQADSCAARFWASPYSGEESREREMFTQSANFGFCGSWIRCCDAWDVWVSADFPFTRSEPREHTYVVKYAHRRKDKILWVVLRERREEAEGELDFRTHRRDTACTERWDGWKQILAIDCSAEERQGEHRGWWEICTSAEGWVSAEGVKTACGESLSEAYFREKARATMLLKKLWNTFFFPFFLNLNEA